MTMMSSTFEDIRDQVAPPVAQRMYGLTQEQKAARKGRIGASFVPSLMAGNEAAIRQEWMRLVEHPDYQEEDFADNWPVNFGQYIEDFSLNWHARKTGQALTRRGEWIAHPERRYIGCTLYAWRAQDNCVLDLKAPGAYRVLDDVLAYYPGQLVVQKACAKADRAALVIVHGGAEPKEFEVTWDSEYEGEVWRRVDWMWGMVESLIEPYPLPPAKGLVPAVRIVDMEGNNAWSDFAATWLQNKTAAAAFNHAAKGIKSLMEDDVVKAFGHGIVANRSRAGAVTIKQA